MNRCRKNVVRVSIYFSLLLMSTIFFVNSAAAAIGAKSVSTVANSSHQSPQQEDDEETRRIWDSGLVKKRRLEPTIKVTQNSTPTKLNPTKPITKAKTQTKTKPIIRYVARTPIRRRQKAKSTVGKSVKTGKQSETAAGSPTAERVVGVTVWKLRKANKPATDDDEARYIVQDYKQGAGGSGDSTIEFTQERTSFNARFDSGEQVRISLEIPFDGYLYVFDREQYKDNKFSEPYLIFPTRATRGGDNKVSQSDVIEIPGRNDSPFRLQPSRADQVAETLTVIISPERLEVPLKDKIWAFPAAQFNEWEQKWSAEADIIDLENGVGRVWTKNEKQAGEETRKITQDDAPPQTIYRLDAEQNIPVFFNIPLLLNRNP